MARPSALIYENEAVFTTLFANRKLVSMFDIMTLLTLNSKKAAKPLDDLGNLDAFWDTLLTYRWDEFLMDNALARLKKAYRWNNETVQAIVAKLRNMVQEHDEKNGVTMLPQIYIPAQFYYGDEELLFVYAMLALYQQTYVYKDEDGSTTETIDLYGQGLDVFRPGVPFVQLEIHTTGDNHVFVTERTRESETKTEVATKESRYEVAAKLYRFMQAGTFTIQLRIPFVEPSKAIRIGVQVDNRLASRNFTFTYKPEPHEIEIRRR